jgi:hypothetical protein
VAFERRDIDDASRRWEFTDAERRAWDEMGQRWQADALWALPRDAREVEEAIAFAYMRADRPLPATVATANGPWNALALATCRGMTSTGAARQRFGE